MNFSVTKEALIDSLLIVQSGDISKLDLTFFDIHAINSEKQNALIFALKHKINLSQTQWQYLIEHSDLKHQDSSGKNALFYALPYNHKNILTRAQIDYILHNSDLNQITQFNYQSNYNCLMFAICHNNNYSIHLDFSQWDYLIKNTDLSYQSEDSMNALMLAISHNKKEQLNIKISQWDYLIKNSSLIPTLSPIVDYQDDTLTKALYLTKSENLVFSDAQWDYLIDNSNLAHLNEQQTTFFVAVIKEKDNLSIEEFDYFINKVNTKVKDSPLALIAALDYFNENLNDFQLFWSLFEDKQFLIDFTHKNNQHREYDNLIYSQEFISFVQRKFLDDSIEKKQMTSKIKQRI